MPQLLDDLLDQAHAALLAGDLAALGRIAPEVEAAAAQVPRDRAAAERLQRKAERNAALLQAATRGLRAAQSRLLQIAEGPVLTTYDAQGRRATVPSLSPMARRF